MKHLVMSFMSFRRTDALKLLLWTVGYVFLFAIAASTHAATLSLSPSQGTYVEGALIPIDIIVESDEQSANAVSGTIVFSSTLLTPVSIETGDSIIDIWIEKPVINIAQSRIAFEGLVLNPGFRGT